jgi:hypothetical protein
MDLVELGAVLGDFFEGGGGPTHDQLDQAVARAGLTAGDPAPSGRTRQGTPLGKTKRIRQVLVYATDHQPAAGLRLAQQIVALLRAEGAFTPALESYAGRQKVERLSDAFARIGFTLDVNGALRPAVIDNSAGTQLTEALQSYVNRINLNPDDAPLQIGTGKELDEAAARHVLEERTGSYPVAGHAGSFPVTLAGAFTAVGFAIPPQVQLDSDPHRQVQQCLFLLGAAVNRLRNQAGTGHGRPSQPGSVLRPSEARLVAPRYGSDRGGIARRAVVATI